MDYTPEQKARIRVLEAMIEDRDIPMAVVDYLGNHDGDGFVTTEDSPTRRFGYRDMRHVGIYNLTVVSRNPAAQKLKGD